MNTKVWIVVVVVVAIIAGSIGYLAKTPQVVTLTTTYTTTSAAVYTTTITTTYTTTSASTTTYTTTVTTTRQYYPIAVRDALNRTVEIASEPATVVSLAPSITQILVALGLCNRIVGLDQFSYQLLEELNSTRCLPANAEVIEINAMSPTGFNGDAIILLHPDIVLADAGLEAMWARDLSKLGVTVYFLNGTLATSYRDIENDIYALGAIFDREQAAASVVQWMESQLEKYGGAANATVAHIVWINPDGSFYAAGNNTFISAEIRAAGGANAINEGGWGPFEPSLLIVANPEVIVLGSMGYNCTYALKALSQIPGISNVAAYKNGRVYVLTGLAEDAVDQPSLMSVYGAAIFHYIITGEAPQCVDTRWFLSQFSPRLGG
ncbi:MAG: ABC transporter substrate-binding protein [Thermoproteus sp.]